VPEPTGAGARPFGRSEPDRLRIAYFDASLRHHTGHQANACRQIVGELRTRGFPVDVYASVEIGRALAGELAARPCFRLLPYDQSKGFRFVDAFAHALSFGHDLRSAWCEGKYPFVVFNSVLAPQFEAIGKWLSSFPAGEAPRAAIEFGAPSGASTDGWFAQFAPRYRKASRPFRALAADRLLLFTFDRAASAEYAGLLELPVATLPSVHAATGSLRRRARRADGLLTIGFLGQQREEKGADLLAGIVRGLRAAGCGERILLHDGEPAERPLSRTLRNLAAQDSLVRYLHQPADPALWQELLSSTDLLVLPYEPKRYGASYSAVAVEAVSAGIPMVVPSGTTMESLAKEYQGRAAVFDSWTAGAVCAAIQRAIASFDELAAAAHAGAGSWQERNGAARFADRLLAFATDPATPLPRMGASAPTVSGLERGAVRALLFARGCARQMLRLLQRAYRSLAQVRP
jgi:hypothetical protein